jgi:hypothetical protein
MKKREILAELTQIACKIGIKIIEDRISEEDKMNILIKALKRNNLENVYLTPKIRELCSENE